MSWWASAAAAAAAGTTASPPLPGLIELHTGQHESTHADGFCPALFFTPRHVRVDAPTVNQLAVWALRGSRGGIGDSNQWSAPAHSAQGNGWADLLPNDATSTPFGHGVAEQQLWLRDSGARVAVLFHDGDVAAAAASNAPRGEVSSLEASADVTRLNERMQHRALRFAAGRNSFPYAYSLPAPAGSAIFILSTAPTRVVAASHGGGAALLPGGLSIVDTLGLRYVIATVAGNGAAEVAALSSVLSAYAKARIPTLLILRCLSGYAHAQQEGRPGPRGAGALAAAAARAATSAVNCSADVEPPTACPADLFVALSAAPISMRPLRLGITDTRARAAQSAAAARAAACEGGGGGAPSGMYAVPTTVLGNVAFYGSIGGKRDTLCTPRHASGRGGSADQHHDPLLCRWSTSK